MEAKPLVPAAQYVRMSQRTNSIPSPIKKQPSGHTQRTMALWWYQPTQTRERAASRSSIERNSGDYLRM